jgi:drug/metabolite transporter (DMT)-like permease
MSISKDIQLAFATAIVSGIAIFVNKFAVTAIQPPLVFTAVKNTGVAILILAWLLTLRKVKNFAKLNRSQWLKLLLVGIIGGSLPFYLFFTGLSQTSAVNAALIHKSLVLWVAILAWTFLKEKLSPLQILAVVLLFASNLIIGGFQGFTWSTGEGMVLAATILWAIENVIAKKLLVEPHPCPSPKRRGVNSSPLRIQDEVSSPFETIHPDLLVAARMGFGSVILLSAAIWQYPQALIQVFTLSSTQWFWMTATAATLLAYVMLWYRALKLAPAVTVTAILVSSTLITNLLSAVFITHVWDADMLIQAGFILLGLAVFAWGSRRRFRAEKKVQGLSLELPV